MFRHLLEDQTYGFDTMISRSRDPGNGYSGALRILTLIWVNRMARDTGTPSMVKIV